MNDPETARCCKLAADQNHSDAQIQYATCLSSGWCVDRDEAEAVRSFRLSVNRDEPSGLFNLGMCYVHGKGVSADLAERRRLLSLAARRGHSHARLQLWLLNHIVIPPHQHSLRTALRNPFRSTRAVALRTHHHGPIPLVLRMYNARHRNDCILLRPLLTQKACIEGSHRAEAKSDITGPPESHQSEESTNVRQEQRSLLQPAGDVGDVVWPLETEVCHPPSTPYFVRSADGKTATEHGISGPSTHRYHERLSHNVAPQPINQLRIDLLNPVGLWTGEFARPRVKASRER
jgi:hypothetical protein